MTIVSKEIVAIAAVLIVLAPVVLVKEILKFYLIKNAIRHMVLIAFLLLNYQDNDKKIMLINCLS